ncbi:hypothetical protein [Pelagicoccus sp. SDUM812002]|uniref:hypothetical protein n=1 Tax=Pelagicoccus sp. SDUM812002 TaxID=3041266 RepID=UPI00280D8107|nr:hypothetical protein [Pelagicoccus sp. SDUM812002]MDQ8184155.1 hypothetical protein [Pelagicoccus sp. SDUM812002]
MRNLATACLFTLTSAITCHGQFFDDFDGDEIEGWFTMTGDGWAEMELVPRGGYARLSVDATKDPYNVWWAIMKQDLSRFLDLEKLKDPAYELRVEIRVRPSVGPRRINVMINTQRTTDYHKQLREFDVSDTSGWSTISMTTQDLDASPGDELNVQLGITDWGHDHYYLDIDYYKADIVKAATNAPELGEPLVYHPETAELDSFSEHLSVAHDLVINPDFPEVNFHEWKNGEDRVLTVNSSQWPILRWDFGAAEGMKAAGPGILELSTQSIVKGGNYIGAYGEDLGVEFGKVRVIEIFGGDRSWDQSTATYESFTHGEDLETLINSQMIFDTELAEDRGGKTYVTLSRPVMQRLLDGTTSGIIIKPLGAISASIYDSENGDGSQAPALHFNLE